jgi:protoheme IX farnesyltransferase
MQMKSNSDVVEIEELPAEQSAGPVSAWRSRAVDFYELTKPRMNFLVVITTMVGYYMAPAVTNGPDYMKLAATLLGTLLTAAGASVLNQYIERDYDKLMPRTKNRPLPGGRIAPLEALAYGVSLGISGVVMLWAMVNPLTAALGAATLLLYLFAYTPLKRVTSLNTVIGAIPGAIPPMMGWTAAYGHMSAEAVALFSILFIWQMPHFLAIAILYKEDYATGGFKMLPNVDGEDLGITAGQIILYNVAMIPVSLAPGLIGMAGQAYAVAAVLLSCAYLTFGVSLAISRSRIDARKLFIASIIYLPLLLAALMLDRP